MFASEYKEKEVDGLKEQVKLLRGALSQLLDRLDFHGSIDPIREEGPIKDGISGAAVMSPQYWRELFASTPQKGLNHEGGMQKVQILDK